MAEQVLPTVQESGPLPLPKFEEGLGAALIQFYSGSSGTASVSPTSSTSPSVSKGAGITNSGTAGSSSGGTSRISSSNNINSSSTCNSVSGSANPGSSSTNVFVGSQPGFKMAIGRRESPLDLSVKTVRQSADSSTSSFTGPDSASHNNVGSTTNNVMSQSMPSSRSSTPNPQNSSNHISGSNSSGSANSVIAAPATSSVKDFLAQPSVVSEGAKLAGSSATSTSGGDSTRTKSKKGSSGAPSPANLPTTNAFNPSHVSSNQHNGISNSVTPNLTTPPHHLFGHHPVHPPPQSHSGIHPMHATTRPSLPYPSQSNHHANHSGPPGTSLNLPTTNLTPHHSIQASGTHQQNNQPQRPSSVIPSYHSHPTNVAPPVPTYHHQYHATAPASHHPYHHGYNQYYPHFPGHGPGGVSHSVPSSNGSATQPHLNYFSAYSPHCPPAPTSQGQLPTVGSSNSSRDMPPSSQPASSTRSGASQSTTLSTTSSLSQAHPSLNYPASKPIPAPMVSHYQPNPSPATQSPHTAYGAYAHSMAGPLPSHPQHPAQYYPPGVQNSRPPLEPSLSAQNLHQPHYSHPNHSSHAYSQPFGQPYTPPGYSYHHSHNANSVVPGHVPQNMTSGGPNASKLGSTAPIHGFSDRSTPKSLSGNSNATTPSTSSGVSNPHVVGPDAERNSHVTGQNSSTIHPPNHNGGSVPSTTTTAPSSKSKGSGSKNGSRDGKTSSRKNILSMLRNSCESRIHEKQEKQEKEKFQFNHQTWNFHGRKFNTVLPTSGGTATSNGSSVNHSMSGQNVADMRFPASSPFSTLIASSSAKSGSPAEPASSSSSLQSKNERDSLQLSALSSEASSAGDASNIFHSLNRIRTKAEKKQLFPNLLSQIEQENTNREKGLQAKKSNASRIGNHGKVIEKAAASVFDFQDDEDDVKSTSKPIKKSPTRRRDSTKKEKAGSCSPTKSLSKDDNLPGDAKKQSAPSTTANTVSSIAPTAAISSKNKPENSKPLESSDPADGFWAVCDSFLTDLASNPTTIKSRRGGLWQKLKGKSTTPKVAKTSAKSKRAHKNSTDEDSDFKVDEDEDKSDDKSEESSSADDDISHKSSDTEDSKGSQSKDSDDLPVTNRKRKNRVILDDDSDSSVKESRTTSKRRKLSPSANTDSRKSSQNKKSGDSGTSKARTLRNDRKGKSSIGKSPVGKSTRAKTSGRNATKALPISDDENNSDRTSTASDNSEESVSSHSFSIDSYSSDSDNSNSSSNSDDSDSYSSSDSDDDDSDSDANSQSSSLRRKSRRGSSKANKKKVLRSSTKSLRSSTRRAAASKNKKSKAKKKKSSSSRQKRKSLRSRNLRNLNLRPKRNCVTPGTKKRLKDLSGESDEELRNEGSSGEEWIMHGELGKTKRRIIFGDGSDFHQPGWEDEVIDYKKKNLRMPSKLIKVAKPSSLSTSVIGGNSSTASSICNNKDVDYESVKENEVTHRTTEKGIETKKKAKSKTNSTPGKTDYKSPATTPSTTPAKSKTKVTADKCNSSDPVISSVEEKGIKLRDKTLREKTKTPEKSGKTANKKDSQEKDSKNTAESISKKDASERYAKLAKEKEAQMLPTPGASGSKFTKKMSIKSVFGVDIAAPASDIDKSTKLTPGNESQSGGITTSTESPAPPPAKKTLRRNKFKSGFDYIRKKKRVTGTPDGSVAPVPSKRVKTIEKELNEEDVAAEIRGWVLRKELGETILHRAARLGYPDVASYCLEHDLVSPNCKDNAGYTPLHETCIKGNLEVAKVILAYGANPSQAAPGGIRPLHEACENGHVELVRLLISYGADPLLATYAGQSPIELAEPHESVRLLLQEHIKDLQGKQDTPWVFRGSGPWADIPYDSGYEITDCAPVPEEPSDPESFEFEASENCLPPLYRLKGEVSFYILLQDLLNYLGQPKDRFLEKNPNTDVVELNSNDFLEQAHCCHLLGEKFNLNSSSDFLTLIKYDDHVKKMLNIESCFIK